MLLTEEQAKDKGCCGPKGLAMVLASIAFSQHCAARGEKPSGDIKLRLDCMGSACMAWRWFDSVSDDGKFCHWIPTKMAMRHPDDTKDKPLDQRRGFCGLAGRP